MEHGDLLKLEDNINFLKKMKNSTEKEIFDFQNESFLKLFKHACEISPFYKELYDRFKISATSIKSIDDISKLPFCDKEMMRSMDVSYVEKLYDLENFMTTGGSTGNPFKIYMDNEFRSKNHANTYFYMEMSGFPLKETRNIRLHGDFFSCKEISEGATFKVLNNRTLVLASNHISKESIKVWVNEINKFKPDYIHAFPSSLYLFIRALKDTELSINVPIRGIFCDCECLYDYQRKLFESFFECHVFNIYGHTEGSVFGINCPETHEIHLNPFVGYTELIDENDKLIQAEGQKGEIVVTGFNNFVMPFIRYKTGDIGIYKEGFCPYCQKNWKRLINIEGRVQDYIIDKNRELVPLAPTLFDYNIDWTGIERFQVHQNKIGEILFLMKMQEGTLPFKKIQSQILKHFKNNFDVQFKMVEEIPFTGKGKYRYLQQNLKMDEYF